MCARVRPSLRRAFKPSTAFFLKQRFLTFFPRARRFPPPDTRPSLEKSLERPRHRPCTRASPGGSSTTCTLRPAAAAAFSRRLFPPACCCSLPHFPARASRARPCPRSSAPALHPLPLAQLLSDLVLLDNDEAPLTEAVWQSRSTGKESVGARSFFRPRCTYPPSSVEWSGAEQQRPGGRERAQVRGFQRRALRTSRR